MACRTARPKQELDRIVRTPAGEIRVDPSGRLAGRGAYLCRGGSCLTLALARGSLARALEMPISAELRDALLTALNPTAEQGGARGQE